VPEKKAEKKVLPSTLLPGEELRGFRVKLYPTQEELRYLAGVQAELMAAWNILVISRETHVDHCTRHAEDHGLVGDVPSRPAVDKTDDSSPKNLAAWEEYERLCGVRRHEAVRLTRAVPGLKWEAWRIDYKILRTLFGGRDAIGSAQMYLSLVHTFRKTKGPRLKKRALAMPLLNRTGGHAITLLRPRVCRVAFGPLRIKGRYHREPHGPFIEGVSIRLEHDGWYAAARVRVVPAALPAPTREIIAINAGLECLYADSEGHVVDNPRGNAYMIRVAELSEWFAEADEHWEQARRRNVLARYQERASRHVEHLIYNEVLPGLAPYTTILIASSGRQVAQGPQTRLSKNAEGGYVSAMSLMHELIKRRFGVYDADKNPTGRVREVLADGISRRCSKCGTEHATRYNRSVLRMRYRETDCQNPKCLCRIHVDVNAARNMIGNYANLQRAAE
jgi:hypothetical protein